MSTSIVPLETYLTTSYEPDCEWVDGSLLERNTGLGPHSLVMASLMCLLAASAKDWGIRVLPVIRIKVSDRRYRVADVCAIRRSVGLERIIETSPLLCAEVLAVEDRFGEMLERVSDYLAMGVSIVWLVDPWSRRAYQIDAQGLHVANELLTVPGTEIRLKVADVFAELGELDVGA
jgi:Uma2 family endonuclease